MSFSLADAAVALSGAALIVFIYWFFLLKKKTAGAAAGGEIHIKVEGGYTPEMLTVPHGQLVKLVFERTDSNSCLEEVIIPDFKVRQFLPLNEKTTVALTPQKPGEYPFSCGMHMYHGKIIVT